MFEAVSLYKGWRKIASKGDTGSNLKIHQLFTYCFFGIVAGIVGGLLGLGGGFIMGPLFLELGVPPQVGFLLLLVDHNYFALSFTAYKLCVCIQTYVSFAFYISSSSGKRYKFTTTCYFHILCFLDYM